MKTVDYNDENYDVWLKTIVDSRLLFNTRKELGEFVGYPSLTSKSFQELLGDNPFRKKAIFHELCKEVSVLTEEEFDLEIELKIYSKASRFYNEKMKNLKYFTYGTDDEIRDHTMNLIDYIYGKHALPTNIPKKVQDVFMTLYDKANDYIKGNYGITYIILILLKKIPPINGRNRDLDVSTLYKDFNYVLDFIKDFFLKQGVNFDIDINMFREKAHLIGKENLNRFFMVYAIDYLIGNYYLFSNEGALNESTKLGLENMLWPQIDGIWCSAPKGVCGDFWEIEEVNNCYFAFHYVVKDGRYLEYKKYEMYLFDYDGHMLDNKSIMARKKEKDFRDQLYQGKIIAPEYLKSKIQEKKVEKDSVCVFVCRIEQQNMSEIEIFPYNSVDWFPSQTLYKHSDKSELKRIVDHWEQIEIGYKGIFRYTIYAITQTHLYVGVLKDIENYDTNNDDRSDYDEYYKIPKTLNSALYDISIGDAVGVLETEEDGVKKRYVGFSNFLRYYDVTTPEDMKKNGIEIVDSIT